MDVSGEKLMESGRKTMKSFRMTMPMLIGVTLLVALAVTAIPESAYSATFTGNAGVFWMGIHACSEPADDSTLCAERDYSRAFIRR